MAEGYPLSYWRQQLKKGDGMTRWRAVRAINLMGAKAKEMIPELRQCLKDREHEVRRESIMALANMGQDGKVAVAEIRELLKDPVPIVRQTAGIGLRSLDPEAWQDAVDKGEAKDDG
jgi:HEAT repeat protein